MIVSRLIGLALNDVGVSDPRPEQYQNALDHLNMIISNFTYWKPEDQPIDRLAALTDTIQLPTYYLEIFELLLAAREAITYGLPANAISLLEQKADQLTKHMTYRRVQNQGIGPSGMVI